MALHCRFTNIEIEELFHELVHGNTQAALKLTQSLKVRDNINKKVNSPANRITQTCLHAACHLRNFPVAKRLLDLGADPDVTDSYQSTPLHNAASEGDLEMVKLLVEYKACLRKTKAGRNALGMARMYGRTQVVNFLGQFEPCSQTGGSFLHGDDDNTGAAGPVIEEEEVHQFSFTEALQLSEAQASPHPGSKVIPEDIGTDRQSLASGTDSLREKVQELEAQVKELKLNRSSLQNDKKPNRTRDEVLKERIHRSFEYIVQNVHCGDHQDFLLSENVISLDDYEELESKPVVRDKNRKLLRMLLSRPASQWVRGFMESLTKVPSTAEFAKDLKK